MYCLRWRMASDEDNVEARAAAGFAGEKVLVET